LLLLHLFLAIHPRSALNSFRSDEKRALLHDRFSLFIYNIRLQPLYIDLPTAKNIAAMYAKHFYCNVVLQALKIDGDLFNN
jgi:hypothetical protein